MNLLVAISILGPVMSTALRMVEVSSERTTRVEAVGPTILSTLVPGIAEHRPLAMPSPVEKRWRPCLSDHSIPTSRS